VVPQGGMVGYTLAVEKKLNTKIFDPMAVGLRILRIVEEMVDLRLFKRKRFMFYSSLKYF
jgi:hypothetical protein